MARVDERGENVGGERPGDQHGGQAPAARQCGEHDRHVEDDRDHQRLRRDRIDDERRQQDGESRGADRSRAHERHLRGGSVPPCEANAVRDDREKKAAALLVELGLTPKLTIYLGGAPGAGKTHRLLTDALADARAGRRVAIGRLETKGRPQLEALAAPLPVIPPRAFCAGDGSRVDDFDLEAALASEYETIVLDELAHANPPGAPHAKRWQDAIALRDGGKSVLGAFNVMHLDTVAPVAERIIGHPVREIVPIAFLRRADRVIALDVAPSILESRLRTGRIVRDEDVDRAAAGVFQPKNLEMMRELLLRTVDDLTVPVVAPSKVSTALAVLTAGVDPAPFVRRAEAFAEALDLALEITTAGEIDESRLAEAMLLADAGRVTSLAASRARRAHRRAGLAGDRSARPARPAHPRASCRSRSADRRSAAPSGRRAPMTTRVIRSASRSAIGCGSATARSRSISGPSRAAGRRTPCSTARTSSSTKASTSSRR